ncbi:phage tail tube protein, partial [Staphylococcus aureus]|uniref:phage tail tube protein n=1 Tax=Staphylococcus aureus TaxID=1280 RepID=UPI00301C0231
MAHLSNGTQVFVEGTRGNTIDVTAITNAVAPVLTLSDATGIARGDYLLFTSSASTLLADKQVRVTAVSGSDVTVEGIDTSNNTKFPAGLT